MEPAGFEPATFACKRTLCQLSYGPRAPIVGAGPATVCETRCHPSGPRRAPRWHPRLRSQRRSGRTEDRQVAGDDRPAPAPRPKPRARSKPAQRAEVSNLDIVRHYFDLAAERLGLREDLRTVFWSPYREVTVQIPVKLSDGRVARLLRLPDPAQRRPRPLQGRGPVPPRGGHRRGPGAGLADDLEDRRRRGALRRRQGRRQLPRRQARAEGAAADRPLLHGQGREGPGADPRHPRPRRQHQRPDDGLVHGRVRKAPRPHPGDLHRQADRAGGIATAARRRPGAAASTCSARPRRSSA